MPGWPEYRDKEKGVDGVMVDIKTKVEFEIEEFITNHVFFDSCIINPEIFVRFGSQRDFPAAASL